MVPGPDISLELAVPSASLRQMLQKATGSWDAARSSGMEVQQPSGQALQLPS